MIATTLSLLIAKNLITKDEHRELFKTTYDLILDREAQAQQKALTMKSKRQRKSLESKQRRSNYQLINRIYRGGRASGKTVHLVKKADECMKNGFTPVFIYSYPAVRDAIRTCAGYLSIDCSEWLFTTYQEYCASRCYNIKRGLVKPTLVRIPDNHVIFIDEAETFIDNLFKCRDVNSELPNILITESDADYKIVTCDWKREDK